MIVTVTMPLFPWDALEDSPSLTTIRKFLASIPDRRPVFRSAGSC